MSYKNNDGRETVDGRRWTINGGRWTIYFIKKLVFFIALLPFCYFLFSSCYTFKSTGISPAINTFYVAEFDNNTSNVVPTLSYDFTQALLDKILKESRLTFTEFEPDIEFSGHISRYQVTSVAPEERNGVPTTAFNRLDIGVQVEYINHKEEDAKKKEWNQQFSFYLDYESTTNLLDIQESLIEQINAQLVEDIFNRAFSDW